MVITVIRVATPMVSPMVVKTARSLCWRSASMLWLRLSARFSISAYPNALPFLADAYVIDPRRKSSGDEFRSRGFLVLTNPHCSGLPFSRRIGHRVGETYRSDELVDVDVYHAAHVNGVHPAVDRHGGQLDNFNILRGRSATDLSIKIRLRLLRRLRRMEVRDDLVREPHFHLHGLFRFHRRNLRQALVRQQLPVTPHQLVTDPHYFTEHHLRRFRDADVVSFRLGHFFDAIQAFKHRHGSNNLRSLAEVPLDLARYEQVEFLVRAAHLNVAVQGDGIVGLAERI